MTRHQKISFVKSGIRIGGYALLLLLGHMYKENILNLSATLLIISEVLGVIEELGQEYGK